MRLSCIVPIYGLSRGENARFFDELVRSISLAAAPLGDQFELVVVNDDKERVAKKDIIDICSKHGLSKRTIYTENISNKGQAYSRNTGAKIAKGDYMHFIDQDDSVSENFYEPLFDSSTIKKDIIISTPFFNKGGEIIKAYTKLLLNSYKRSNKLKDLWFLLLSNIVYSPGQILVSRNAYEKSRGFPVLKYRGADDFAFFYRLVFEVDNISTLFVPESSFFYRIHSQQNSRISSTNESACEFLHMNKPQSLKQRVIFIQKTKRWAGILGTLLYITFFRRAGKIKN